MGRCNRTWKGGEGVIGCSMIPACKEGDEMHSVKTDTVNVYIPAGRFIIMIVPDPAIVFPSGLYLHYPVGI